jgi:parallel beta-helix repeat protein
MRRNRALFVVLVVIVGIAALALTVNVGRSSPTIYIRADGSVQGTSQIVSSDNMTYIFKDDINDSIVVERSNVIINGNGSTLQGSGGGDGFTLSNVNNVTIANTTIQGFNRGIKLTSTNGCTITNNTIRNNQNDGIYLYPAFNTTITYNTVSSHQGAGIVLADAANNTVKGNIIDSDNYGVYFFQNSDNNTIHNNLITNCYQSGMYIINDTNNKITDNNVTNIYYDGINFNFGSNNLVRGNSATNCSVGIFIGGSNLYTSNFTLENNTISGTPYTGIELSYTTGNKIVGNTISNTTAPGSQCIHIISSNNITVARNIISNSSSIGIQLSSSINNNVTENLVTACGVCGIYTDYGSGNRIIGNSVFDSLYAINVISSSNDYIYHNYFINNTHQADTTFSGVNHWDNGYPLPEGGGNYWSDFKTRYPPANDTKSGQYQNVTGSDGIWDSPYVIDANNKDNYPLVPEFSSFASVMIPLFMVTMLVEVLILKRKRGETIPQTSTD